MPELEPLDADILALLAHEKPVPELDPSRKAAILARVEATIGPVPPDGGGGDGGAEGGGPGTTPGAGAGATATKAAAAGGAKAAIALAATFALGVAAGVAGDRALSAGPSVPAASTVAVAPPEAPIASVPETRGVPVSALPSVAPARAPVATTTEKPSEPAPSARGLAAERALLDVARTALARGEAGDALAAADRHAKTYPDGALVEEREAIAIKALVALGRRDEARRRAGELERKYPNSLVLRAVKNAVEDSP